MEVFNAVYSMSSIYEAARDLSVRLMETCLDTLILDEIFVSILNFFLSGRDPRFFNYFFFVDFSLRIKL